jgi:hypothetical protein
MDTLVECADRAALLRNRRWDDARGISPLKVMGCSLDSDTMVISAV